MSLQIRLLRVFSEKVYEWSFRNRRYSSSLTLMLDQNVSQFSICPAHKKHKGHHDNIHTHIRCTRNCSTIEVVVFLTCLRFRTLQMAIYVFPGLCTVVIQSIEPNPNNLSIFIVQFFDYIRKAACECVLGGWNKGCCPKSLAPG
jgi:hypothetical protein